MADNLEFSLIGIDSLVGKLESISYDMKRKGGRSALRKAAQLIRDKAREGADRYDDPETKSKISENIVERWNGYLFKRTGDLGFRIGVMGKAGVRKSKDDFSGLPGGDTRHWFYLEFGTSEMAAKPFMRTALSQNIQAATDAFIVNYETGIDRALKRAAKAAGSS